MKVSIILVSYNTAELTLQTLHSIQKAESKRFLDGCEVIIVDNNSNDDSVKQINAWKKSAPIPVTILRNSENVGFGVANNQAAEVAQGKYLFFLNSDTIVTDHAIETMYSYFQDHPADATTAHSTHSTSTDNIGIIAAHLQNLDNTYQPQGGALPNLLTLFATLFFIDDLPIIGRLVPSIQHTGRVYPYATEGFERKGWVGGTALCIPRTLFLQLGMFDPGIFMYGEDIELCIKAHKHHYDRGILHSAKITHLQSASSSSKNAIKGELLGYLYIWSKHKPIWQYPFVKHAIRIAILLRRVLFATIGNQEKAERYAQVASELKKEHGL